MCYICVEFLFESSNPPLPLPPPQLYFQVDVTGNLNVLKGRTRSTPVRLRDRGSTRDGAFLVFRRLFGRLYNVHSGYMFFDYRFCTLMKNRVKVRAAVGEWPHFGGHIRTIQMYEAPLNTMSERDLVLEGFGEDGILLGGEKILDIDVYRQLFFHDVQLTDSVLVIIFQFFPFF